MSVGVCVFGEGEREGERERKGICPNFLLFHQATSACHGWCFPLSPLRNALELSSCEVVPESHYYITDYQLFHRRLVLTTLKNQNGHL